MFVKLLNIIDCRLKFYRLNDKQMTLYCCQFHPVVMYLWFFEFLF